MGWIIFLLGTLGWHIGMYGMFQKAGITPWKAFVPFYNTWEIVKVCNLKRMWFWLQLIPIVGQFITIWITIIFVMHFGRFNVLQHSAATFLPFIYFPYLGFSKNERFAGHAVYKNYKKPVSREWIDAAVFAVVAATIIRTFIFEAYTIPTPSMEKTLLVNDFLFVNKMAYGPRIPQTPLSFPFVHNLMPRSQVPSYLKWLQLDYKRLPGYRKVQRNDVVVFNFPMGDTIINRPEYGSAAPYYEVLRKGFNNDRKRFFASDFGDDIIIHPMDKADNYIKRCVAIAGDTLQIVEGVLYINGQPANHPVDMQINYKVYVKPGMDLNADLLKENLGITIRMTNETAEGSLAMYKEYGDAYRLTLSADDAAKLKTVQGVDSVVFYPANKIYQYRPDDCFPQLPASNWDVDNYGPIVIPQKGATVALTEASMPFYRRIIDTYEGNTLEEKNGSYTINGQQADSYTFKYNYYWMMGDNRHASQDSRFWGFVPETHIVGRASMIWFSWEKGPRWKRLFRSIK